MRGRKSGRWLAALIVVGALAGCRDKTPPPPAPVIPAPPPASILAPRQVTTDAAFDLVASGQGAVLVWAPPGIEGNGIRLVRLNALGGAFGNEVTAYEPRKSREGESLGPKLPLEVSASTGGGRIVIAWLLRDQMTLRVGATYGNLSTLEFAPALDWGRAEPVVDARERSTVATAAAPDGTMSVFYRSTNTRCKNEDGIEQACASFFVRRVGSANTDSRQGVPLAVPVVCDQPIVGYLWSENTWYYGICAKRKAQLTTTVYAIQFEPEYALAEQVLEGRVPIGFVPSAGGATVVGRGTGTRDAVRFSDGGRRRTHFDAAEVSAKCVEGRPVLTAQATGGAVESTPLTEPRSRLEALLPSDLATDRARAVWTGKALLVAFPQSGEVALHRFECLGEDLERTDL